MEVLDPLLRENYLTEAEVVESAEQIAHSEAVQALGDNVKQSTVEDLEAQGVDPVVLEEARRVGFTRTICQAAVSGVMKDGLGRSEMHMAAEACRVNFAFHKILKEEVGLEFVVPEGLDVIENLRASGTNALWNPTDTPMTCPTIDGFPIDRDRHFVLYGVPQSAKAFHQTWYAQFRNDLFKLTVMGVLEIIKPPIFLIGGNIIAGNNPKFFAMSSRNRGGDFDEPTPREPELVLV